MADMTPTPPEALLPCPFCNAPAHIEDGPTPMCGYKIHASCGPDCRVAPSVWAEYAPEAIAAWNTRPAQPVVVAPDDEAWIRQLADESAKFERSKHGQSQTDYGAQALAITAAEALRCQIAELRARIDRDEAAITDLTIRTNSAEAALKACRAATIEECAAALKAKQAMLIDVGCDGPVVNAFSSAMGVIRALKTQEPTNG